ncbi:CLUMA_CG021209, isoform A [Clunio marinus]|uniref:CLUMA_CG021209, isoform A n=1 Tax=Clunio marinus TaxID=568069 RepID=A0A1J1J6R6_9DIPT|nr:CLUMA_CG021209, isoform A [Clunio marinus]
MEHTSQANSFKDSFTHTAFQSLHLYSYTFGGGTMTDKHIEIRIRKNRKGIEPYKTFVHI